MDDQLGAIVERIPDRPHAEAGPLAGQRFMAKDLFDVSGYPTRAGNPDYAEWRGIPTVDAWAVRALGDAGAQLVAKTHTHELAYGLTGVNAHFGTPRNPHDSDRIAGGSSSGSAAAVGSGMAPFALGTDTAGSIRLPASLCGIFGLRPTHGRIPVEGLVPLAPSFDTVGTLARDAATLQRVARVLLSRFATPTSHGFKQAVLPSDAAAFAEQTGLDAVSRTAERLRTIGIEVIEAELAAFEAIRDVQSILGGAQVWSVHEDWITEQRPRLGSDLKRKLTVASELRVAEIGRALAREPRLVRSLDDLLGNGETLLVLPASPDVAPNVSDLEDPHQAQAFRSASLALVTPASLGGLPAVAVPSAHNDGLPVGAQLVGPRGSDERLLQLIQDWPSLNGTAAG
ncbi:MAG: amidase family protein [Candidatus Bipolaricaulia bacterium]